MIEEGSIVSRKKYNNDVIFKVIKIENNIYYLEGINIRLCADSYKDDLVLEQNQREEKDLDVLNSLKLDLNRGRFFLCYTKNIAY